VNEIEAFNFKDDTRNWFVELRASVQQHTANGWRVAALTATMATIIVIYEPVS
jgi:hypothetical protein